MGILLHIIQSEQNLCWPIILPIILDAILDWPNLLKALVQEAEKYK